MPQYKARPVIVTAKVIESVNAVSIAGSGPTYLNLDDGTTVTADAGMLARYVPVAGDYYVVQADGYGYVNPKAVFERKYAPCDAASSRVRHKSRDVL